MLITKVCYGYFHNSFRSSETSQFSGSLSRHMAVVSLITGSLILSSHCGAPLSICNAETNIHEFAKMRASGR